jgi:ABC-type multidrug transport system fused ATPase/permease subunit
MILLAVLILISAVSDVLSLGLILPIISIATQPSIVQENSYLSWCYNYFNFTSVQNFTLALVVAVLIFYIPKNIFALLVNWIATKFTIDVAVHITRNQFNKYYELNYLDFSNVNSAIILNHVFNNPTSYIIWIINPLILLFSELLIVLFIVIFMIANNPLLFACIICTVGPATFLIYQSLKNVNTQIGQGMDLAFPKAVAALNHAVLGYTDVKLAGKENVFRKNYLDAVQRYHTLNMKGTFLNLIPMRAYEIVAMLGIVVIFFFISMKNELSSNADALKLVVLFAVSASRIMPSLNRIVSSMMYIRKTQVAITNLNFMKEKHQTESVFNNPPAMKFDDSISFNDVCFKFPEQENYLLKNINIKIKKGEKIGFIGSSGSGKTTLMNIFLRFINENSGSITIDGQALNHDNIRSWRKLLGYVKQDIFILDGSIKDNVAFGEDVVDEKKLQKALQQSSLQPLVDSMPNGADTPVGEKGSKLSGGQRQRVGIARALYRDAEILVFDEATSALDNTTEAEVTEAIDKLSDTNKTIFIIAHRVTTLKNCDRIYELDKGEIKNTFTYQQLIAKVM